MKTPEYPWRQFVGYDSNDNPVYMFNGDVLYREIEQPVQNPSSMSGDEVAKEVGEPVFKQTCGTLLNTEGKRVLIRSNGVKIYLKD